MTALWQNCTNGPLTGAAAAAVAVDADILFLLLLLFFWLCFTVLIFFLFFIVCCVCVYALFYYEIIPGLNSGEGELGRAHITALEIQLSGNAVLVVRNRRLSDFHRSW